MVEHVGEGGANGKVVQFQSWPASANKGKATWDGNPLTHEPHFPWYKSK